MKKPSAGYANGIRIRKRGTFDYDIVNPSKIAEHIENGADELDKKTTQPYGPRSRVAHKRIKGSKPAQYRDVPYLIVPFR
jgi:hypothetical protein